MNTDLQGYLHAAGRRNTAFKQQLFALLDTHDATTTNELLKKVSKNMDRATVYRILKEFREHKIIRDVVVGGVRKIELTEKFSSHHHHLVCARCGKVVNINDMRLEQYLKQLAPSRKFLHLSHSFEITGLCSTCKPQSTSFEAAE